MTTHPDVGLVLALALLYGGLLVTALVTDLQDARWRRRSRGGRML